MAGRKTPVELPEIKPPAPIADEEMLNKKRKENVRKQRKRTGRQSTILSERLG